VNETPIAKNWGQPGHAGIELGKSGSGDP